jgi:3-oxoadipate enol-lactonase
VYGSGQRRAEPKNQRKGQLSMAKVSINGIELHFHVEGTEGAPALLFSNSLGTNLGMWDGQIDELAPHFHIIRYDSRGHGKSTAPDEDYTIDTLGRDALGLLDHLELDTVFYCGLSKGGMVGQWLGINAPERLTRMVLANTSSFLSPPGLWNSRIEAVRDGGMEAITETVIERWFTPAFQAAGGAEIDRVRDMLLTTPPQGYARCSAAIRDMDQRIGLPSIKVPTLVIVGDQDPATPPEHGELIADAIPGARLAVIENAAHLSNIEQPDQFIAALRDFLLD